jgi:hypothetical protein
MEFYLVKNNLHYFTFFLNSEKPTKAVIRYLSPNTPAQVISSSLEGLGFNVINVRKLMTTRTAPNGQIHVEVLPLVLASLTRNTKSQELF